MILLTVSRIVNSMLQKREKKKIYIYIYIYIFKSMIVKISI